MTAPRALKKEGLLMAEGSRLKVWCYLVSRTRDFPLNGLCEADRVGNEWPAHSCFHTVHQVSMKGLCFSQEQKPMAPSHAGERG